MASLLLENDEEDQVHKLAKAYVEQGNDIGALELIEDLIWRRGRDKVTPKTHLLQGSILYRVADTIKNNHAMKFTLLLGSFECFWIESALPAMCGLSLFEAAQLLGSVLYYKKAVKISQEVLSSMPSMDQLNAKNKSILERIIQLSNSKVLRNDRIVQDPEAKVKESKEEIPNRTRGGLHSSAAAEKRLRSLWAGMDVESKRNFMKVRVVKLKDYVERLHGKQGLYVLKEVLESAEEDRKWKFWMCRACSHMYFYVKKFRNHLEQEHAAKFKPSTTKFMPQRVDELWARMISDGSWEPVNAVAATDLIKTELESVKEFAYENGWSKSWPLAEDAERSKLLEDIHLLLVSFLKCEIFSSSIRDWLVQFSVKHLAQYEVFEHTLTNECGLVETPQIICFLEYRELDQMLKFLKQIKSERNDGTNLISRTVDGLWDRTRVKEKIEFNHQCSLMLLDKRLLKGKIASFDDEGTIEVCDDYVYYAKTYPQGDDVITWLLECPLTDDSCAFPKSIRSYNLDTWVAVLRAIHFACRTLGTKYANKLRIVSYNTALVYAENLCVLEDERRSNILKDQWNTYASLIVDECDKRIKANTEYHLFLCAARDVLEEVSQPTFDFPDLEERQNLLHGLKNLSDDRVLNYIHLLKSAVTNKVPLIDSKILLVEKSRVNLLNDLLRLSVFDHRSYILQLLKRFLRVELGDMDAKAKVPAEDEVKKSGSKKKKTHSTNKRTSTSMSSPLAQKAEHESSVNLEPEVTSPSQETVEEESVDQEATLSSERGRLEISSSSEAAKDMENTSEEDSQSKQLESAHGTAATRCSSALDMTMKALCSIKVLKEELLHNWHLFPDDLEEQVSSALQNFLTSFVSEHRNEEGGDYSHHLSVILASLEKACSMPSHPAEFLVSILEFWPCWKSLERESLVTCLFMLEEYERMCCSKCRRKPNNPEQSSYGIVMAADSVRDLKCAFGNIEFEDILRVIRMENKLLCDIKRGGCGEANFVHHIRSRLPPIFPIVLEWEKDETEKEISETTKALNWEIDISRLYEESEPNTKYRLVSMVGCVEEKGHICLAYKENQWYSFREETSAKEAVGNWKRVVKFCGERKVRLEVLFYEALQWPNK